MLNKQELRVLIVDDNEIDSQHYQRCLLKNERYQSIIFESSTCEQAFAILEGCSMDCLLIDYNMPGHIGLEFLAKLQQADAELDMAIIFLTGEGNENIAAEAMKHGADDYIPKAEVSADRLNYAVNKALEKKKMERELSQQHEKLTRMAHFDLLTECLNRHSFTLSLTKQVETTKRHQREMALLFIDLDYFKHINDHYGHEVGDGLLVETARRIQSCCRRTDVLGRLGGDEFALALSEIKTTHDAGRIAQKIIEVLKRPFIINDKEIHICASIGIACLPSSAISAEQLTQYADMAMYRAKHKGRNQYAYFSDALNKTHQQRLSLEQALNVAMEREQFFLVYQPQYDLQTKSLVGIEALLRWQHPDNGLILPSEFIPIAEDTGMIREMGDWVLEQACEHYQAWLSENLEPPKLAINVSAKQLSCNLFIDHFKKTLTNKNVAAKHIEFELTETTLMGNDFDIVSVLETLQAMQVRIAIDDFGTGYSSFAQLGRILPIHTLKIDMSFVDKVINDFHFAMMTKSMIDIGHNLGLTVIAEGVETMEQMEFFHQNNCDQVQGYFLSEPMSPQSIRDLFVSRCAASSERTRL